MSRNNIVVRPAPLQTLACANTEAEHLRLAFPAAFSCYNLRMFRRIANLAVIVTILLMAASPLFEIFDRWDNIPATGNDTALTLVVIAACIGICFAAAKLTIRLLAFVFHLVTRLSQELGSVLQPFPHTLDYELLLFSPPLSPVPLRI